jgi:hypothetical protein
MPSFAAHSMGKGPKHLVVDRGPREVKRDRVVPRCNEPLRKGRRKLRLHVT